MYSGCNLLKHPWWKKWVIVLFKLSSIVEAQLSCRNFSSFTLLAEGDGLVEYLFLKWTCSFLNYYQFLIFPRGGIFRNSPGIWWFFLQVEMGLFDMCLTPSILDRIYSKGKESDTCV